MPVDAVLIVGACLFLSADRLFPGWWALLPITGACLLIAAGPDAAGNRLVLRNRVMVWFGLISYPVYLWHWPLIVFQRTDALFFADSSRIMTKLTLIAASVGIAFLSWKFVEIPFRSRAKDTSKTAVFGLASAAMVVLPTESVVLISMSC